MTDIQSAIPVAGTVIYRIFVAGPSDVSADMELAKQAIADASLVAQPFGVKFEPFDWHEVPPAAGDEPQEVISNHASGYHALIAIFGAKAGTPTKRFPSGTIEEVSDALEKISHLQFGGLSLMVFFREQKVSLRHIDIESARKLQEFRSKLSERGLFYKDYESETELREAIFRSVGIFLSHHIKGLGRPDRPALKVESNEPVANEGDEPEEELGLLDYQEIIESSFATSASALNEVNVTMVELTQKIEAMRGELETANAQSDRQRGHVAINELARAMNLAADRFDDLSPVISGRFEDALQASDRIIELQAADFGEDTAQETRKRTLEAFQELRPGILIARDSMNSNIETQRSLARITKEFNIAKRKMLSASGKISDCYSNIIAQIDDQINRLSH